MSARRSPSKSCQKVRRGSGSEDRRGAAEGLRRNTELLEDDAWLLLRGDAGARVSGFGVAQMAVALLGNLLGVGVGVFENKRSSFVTAPP